MSHMMRHGLGDCPPEPVPHKATGGDPMSEQETEITTAEELDALPVGSVVRDRDGDEWTSLGEGVWETQETEPFGSDRIVRKWAPLTLVSRPDASAAAGLLVTPEHDAQVAARALREAAEYLFEDEDAGLNVVLGGPGYVHYWLRERADRIERQEEGR